MDNHDVSSNPTTAAAAFDGSIAAGLIISKTESLQSFLSTSANNTHLSQDLRQMASSLSLEPSSVPYKSLRSIWVASDPSTRPALSAVLDGSQFIFNSPQPRQKSEELKARLRKFEEAAERNAYKALVKDITPRREESEPFSSYKDQIGFDRIPNHDFTYKITQTGQLSYEGLNWLADFGLHGFIEFWQTVNTPRYTSMQGLHVALTMFTGYLVGYATFRALFGHSPVMHAAGGILGLVVGMLVETVLFIIRTSSQDRRKTTFTATKLKKNQ